MLMGAGLPFVKMQAFGNDIVILPRAEDLPKNESAELIRHMADRRCGIGADQVMGLAPARKASAHKRVIIWNSDGRSAQACGNGTRCVVWYLFQAYGWRSVILDGPAGLLTGEMCERVSEAGAPLYASDLAQNFLYPCDGVVRVQQGYAKDRPALDLREKCAKNGITQGFPVSLGNHHLVVPVSDLKAVCVEACGAQLTKAAGFAEGANIIFFESDPEASQHECMQPHCDANGIPRVRARVFERGVGPTPACASAACALGRILFDHVWPSLQPRRVLIQFEAGALMIEDEGGCLFQTAPVSFVASGHFR